MDLEYPDMVYGGVSFNTNAQKIQADLAESASTSLLPGESKYALEKYPVNTAVGYWLWGPDILLDFLSFMPWRQGRDFVVSTKFPKTFRI